MRELVATPASVNFDITTPCRQLMMNTKEHRFTQKTQKLQISIIGRYVFAKHTQDCYMRMVILKLISNSHKRNQYFKKCLETLHMILKT